MNEPLKIENPIKESITLSQTHGWWATLSDWLTQFFFSESPILSPIIKNNILSDKISNLFEDTNVVVYVYDSKKISCFTMLGIVEMATPTAMRLQNTSLNGLTNYISNIEKMFSLFQSFGTKEAVLELTYNKYSGKYILNIPEISIYMSNGMIDVLDNDEEIIAILLSEVGQNLQICSKFASDALFGTSKVTGIFASCLGVVKFLTEWLVNSNFWDEIDIGGFNIKGKLISMISLLTIVSICSYFIACYMNRKRQVYSDKFVALIGYGEPFYNAIKKINTYIYDSSIKTEAIKGLNIMDRILHFINKVITFFGDIGSFLGINSRLSIKSREDYAKENLNGVIGKINNDPIDVTTKVELMKENNFNRFNTIKEKLKIIQENVEKENKINNKIIWNNVHPLEDKDAINKIEKKYHLKLPFTLKDIITKFNGGIPSFNRFDIKGIKENIFARLISFNKKDKDLSFKDIKEIFEITDKHLRLFPFAADPDNNFICLGKDGKIVYYFTKEKKTFFIANTFIEFMNILYK